MCLYAIKHENSEIAKIKYDWFGGAKSPTTSFCVTYKEKSGFLVDIVCEEENPIARFSDDEDVFKDSCVEFFVNFYPRKDKRYLNFEINSKGAMLCMIGKTRSDRVFARELVTVKPLAAAYIHDDRWEAHLTIPNEFIKQIYDSDKFESGDLLRGNFYKCGDETKSPHWGSWNTLGENPIDFHDPDTFGCFVIN
ncbi:MAG: carbohydrate-binding family 9-like protein [Oscillospiraceae bacterium]